MSFLGRLSASLSGGGRHTDAPPPDPRVVEQLEKVSIKGKEYARLAVNPDFIQFMADVSLLEKDSLEDLGESEKTRDMIKLKARLSALKDVKAIVPETVEAGKQADRELSDLTEGEDHA